MQGGNQTWTITVEPSGNGAVSRVLVYDEGRLCGCEAELRARLEGHGVTVVSATDPLNEFTVSGPGE